MNMKKGILLFLLISFIMSCSHETIEDSFNQESIIKADAVSAVPCASSVVDEALASKVAERFIFSSNRSRAYKSRIKEVKAIKDCHGKNMMYIVNYCDEKGFVIISADKDYWPILAFSETGNFAMSNDNGSALWIESQIDAMSNVATLPDSIKENANMLWSLFDYDIKLFVPQKSRAYESPAVDALISNQLAAWKSDGKICYTLADFKNTEYYSQLTEEQREELEYIKYNYANKYYNGGVDNNTFLVATQYLPTQVGPIINTQWHQFTPYNQYIPNSYPTGCTTIAAGQIMNYHKYPDCFEWEQIRFGGNICADFLYKLALRIGVVFSADGSTASIQDVNKALIYFGYKNAKPVIHQSSKVIGQIEAGWPVYMRGENNSKDGKVVGHAWVCDGFHGGSSGVEWSVWALENCPPNYEPNRICKFNKYGYEVDPSSFWHTTRVSYPYTFSMNWGTGSGNGFFSDIYLNGSYKENRWDIINIYPVK